MQKRDLKFDKAGFRVIINLRIKKKKRKIKKGKM